MEANRAETGPLLHVERKTAGPRNGGVAQPYIKVRKPLADGSVKKSGRACPAPTSMVVSANGNYACFAP